MQLSSHGQRVGVVAAVGLLVAILGLLFGDDLVGRCWPSSPSDASGQGNASPQVFTIHFDPVDNRPDANQERRDRSGTKETTFRPPLEIKQVTSDCKGCPGDHATFSFLLFNSSDHTLKVDTARAILQEVRQMIAPPSPRARRCETGDYRSRTYEVLIDVDTMREGDSFDIPLQLSIAPRSETWFQTRFWFVRDRKPTLISDWLIKAVFVLPSEPSDLTNKLELCGPSEDGVLREWHLIGP